VTLRAEAAGAHRAVSALTHRPGATGVALGAARTRGKLGRAAHLLLLRMLLRHRLRRS
jgi:hypothetical protein